MKLKLITLLFLFVTVKIVAEEHPQVGKCIRIDHTFIEEETLRSKVLKELNIKEDEIESRLYSQTVLPFNKKLLVMVIPKISYSESDAEMGIYEYDAYIIVLDKITGQIKNKFIEKRAWTSDAIALSSITIDTAIYNLNSTVKGFAVRVNYSAFSKASPYSETEFSLFIKSGDSLTRVLKNYPITLQHGGWDTDCEGEFESIECTITMDKIKSNNFNNIIINKEISKTENHKINDDCKETVSNSKETVLLKFNKMEYK
jgi:hypothetical protein